jgi:hypothetical protein
MQETQDRARASRRAVGVVTVMVAGLIAVAVANEEVISHPYGDTSIALSLLLSGGSIRFLLAQGWYFWAVLQVRELLRPVGSAVLLVVGLLTLLLQPSAALLLVAACLVTIAILDKGLTKLTMKSEGRVPRL